jgi:branched-chain amino acid transport system substrate-binding protein
MNLRGFFFRLTVLSLMLAILGFSAFNAGAQTKLTGKEVLIGGAFGYTGKWKDWITKNEIAVDMAVNEINAAGGIGGVPLRVITYDTASKPTEATRMVRKLAADDKVLAILGPFSTGEAEVAFPVANNLAIPLISQASSKPGYHQGLQGHCRPGGL